MDALNGLRDHLAGQEEYCGPGTLSLGCTRSVQSI